MRLLPNCVQNSISSRLERSKNLGVYFYVHFFFVIRSRRSRERRSTTWKECMRKRVQRASTENLDLFSPNCVRHVILSVTPDSTNRTITSDESELSSVRLQKTVSDASTVSCVSVDSFSDFARPLLSPPIVSFAKEPEDRPSQTKTKTPLKSKRKVQKHASAFRFNKASKNRHYRCSDAIEMMKRVLKSPSTKDIACAYVDNSNLFDILNTSVSGEVYMSENKEIQKQVRRISVFSSKKKMDKVKQAVRDLKKVSSLHSAARKCGLGYGHFQQMIRSRKGKNRGGKLVTIEDKGNIERFFLQANVTMQIPIKRFSHFFYLRVSKKEAYKIYVRHHGRNNLRVLALSTVWKYLPKWVKAMKHVPHKECLCLYCLNWGLLTAAMVAVGIKGLSRSSLENILNTLCKPTLDKPIWRRPEKQAPEQKGKQSQLVIQSRIGKKKRYAKNDSNASVTHVQTVSNTANPAQTITEKESCLQITDFQTSCLFGYCGKCNADQLISSHIDQCNPDLDPESPAIFRQWENVMAPTGEYDLKTGRAKLKKIDFTKVQHTTTVGDLMVMWLQCLNFMQTHLYHFQRQAKQFELCKETLVVGEVLMVLDFAMNMTHQPYNEPQTAMWYRKQSTIHPFVCYFVCPKCERHLVSHEIICISADNDHDPIAVKAYQVQAIKELQDRLVPVLRIIQFTDNCCEQYKSFKTFSIQSDEKIKFERHYFGTQHGKGPADAAIGKMKRQVDDAVKTHRANIIKPVDLYLYCAENLSFETVSDGGCVTARRSFHYKHSIDRSVEIIAATYDGTQRLHSVYSTGVHNEIIVRQTSCFCVSCKAGNFSRCTDDTIGPDAVATKWDISGTRKSKPKKLR